MARHGINRIRLEFKAEPFLVCTRNINVLIESDWNLKEKFYKWQVMPEMRINRIRLEFKVTSLALSRLRSRVLIESDWNLKFNSIVMPFTRLLVLIESDWNLKVVS